MTPTQFVTAYLDAWNRRDTEAALAFFHPQAEYSESPYPELILSYDDIRQCIEEWLSAPVSGYELLGDVFASDNQVVYRYRYELDVGGGRLLSLEGMQYLDLSEGLIRKLVDCYSADVYYETDRGWLHSNGSPRYARSGLATEQAQEIVRNLEVLMSQRLLFQDPGLTMPMVAEQLGCSVNHLSEAVNTCIGKSFRHYLNGCRVALAQQIFAAPDSARLSVVEVASTAGFNSMASFYKAFRKETGMTPAEYRKSLQGLAAAS